MVVEATLFGVVQTKEIDQNNQETTSESCKLDCIYDNEPLGFEKDPLSSAKKIQAQYPLEKVDLGYGITKCQSQPKPENTSNQGFEEIQRPFLLGL